MKAFISLARDIRIHGSMPLNKRKALISRILDRWRVFDEKIIRKWDTLNEK